MANPRVPGEGTWPSTHEEASAPPPPLRHPERASRRGTGRRQLLSIETGPQPRRRLLLAPGIVAGTGLGCGGSSVPGPMANPGGWTVNADNDRRPTEERRLPCPRYQQTGQRPRPTGGIGDRASDLPGRLALERALGGSSAATSTQRPCPVPPTPAQANGGPKAPPAPLTPLRWLRARTATWLPRWPGHARGRLQSRKQAAPVPGGPRREPPTLIMNRSPDRALAQLQPLHQVASRRGLARRSSASSSRCIISSLRIRSSRAQGWEG